MERFVKGDIVVVPFPYSDLSGRKKRPAFVITDCGDDDIIICKITSQNKRDNFSILLQDSDFAGGSLKKISNIRPNKFLTIDKRIVFYKAGCLKSEMTKEVIEKIIQIIES